jgi:hypothetical protein
MPLPEVLGVDFWRLAQTITVCFWEKLDGRSCVTSYHIALFCDSEQFLAFSALQLS